MDGVHNNFSQNSSNSSETDLCINHESWGTPIVLVESSFIIFGNLFVLLVLSKYPSKKFKPLNCFIVQLALADLCVGGIILWIGFLSAKVYSYVSLTSGIVVYGILATATSVSTLSILCIAIDRYIYILRHQRYKKIMTKTLVSVMIIVSWLLPTSVFILAPLGGWSCIKKCDCGIYNGNVNQEYCLGDECSQMMTPFKAETLLVGGICLLVLLLASVIIYILLLSKVRTKTQAPVKHKRRKASEMRMIKTMVIVLSGFLLTTGPLAFLCIVSYFNNDRQLHMIMRVMVVICNINSIMNPFFYFWRIPHMNRNLSKLSNALLGCFRNSILCCAKKISNRRFSAATDANYTGANTQRTAQTSESDSTGSKIHYLNKTIKINLEHRRQSGIHTPWSSSNNIL
ncbi:adenosine receptor A1-like isoform X2 [Styela clava]|uniref:adenosine receptor A1-like isoform X3 n=1 Tax=Styela clava TaxID=7725 RepID=UPI00193A1DA3|nr:adenosine receptor A1-like isoform X3 [Styela clava]